MLAIMNMKGFRRPAMNPVSDTSHFVLALVTMPALEKSLTPWSRDVLTCSTQSAKQHKEMSVRLPSHQPRHPTERALNQQTPKPQSGKPL
jgi:hypothetical protein